MTLSARMKSLNAARTPGGWTTVPHPDEACSCVGVIDATTLKRDQEIDPGGSPFASAGVATCYSNGEHDAAFIAFCATHADEIISALEGREAVLGEAAKVAEAHATCGCNGSLGTCLIDDAANACAAAIRALKDKPEREG